MPKRLKPSEITEENAEQAIDQMITDMRVFITNSKRTEEMLRAMYQQTGNKKYNNAAGEIHKTILELEAAITE